MKLTLLINVINGWNRIAVGFGGWADPAEVRRCQGGRCMIMNVKAEDAAGSFEPLRPKLMRVAYRMLGSVHDAEDVLQEAFLRWMNADRGDVREPEAFLRRWSRASVSISSNLHDTSARPILARGFPIR